MAALLEDALEGLMLAYLQHHIVQCHNNAKPTPTTTAEHRRRRKLSLVQLEQRCAILQFCYAKAVRSEPSCTERDVYYLFPQCFTNQQQLSSVLFQVCDDLSSTVPQGPGGAVPLQAVWTKPDLGIDATAKALLIGRITLLMSFDPKSGCNAERAAFGSNSMRSDGVSEKQEEKEARDVYLGDQMVRRCGRGSTPSVQQRINVAKMDTRGLAIGSAIAASVVGVQMGDSNGPYLPSPAMSGTATSPRRPLHEFGNDDTTASSTARAAWARRDVPFLLVVEKESTVRHLINVDKVLDTHPNCAILSTRGYPCAASRAFLRAFRTCLPNVPVLTMADGDVYGLHIAWSLLKTPADDLTWGRMILKRGGGAIRRRQVGELDEAHKKKRSVPREPVSRAAATITEAAALALQLRGCKEWQAFAEFAATVQHVGLTPRQIKSLGVPLAAITEVTAAEVQRAEVLCSELAWVRDCLMASVTVGEEDTTTPSTTGGAVFEQAARTVGMLVQHLQAMVSMRQKAELQSLAAIGNPAQHGAAPKGVLQKLLG